MNYFRLYKLFRVLQILHVSGQIDTMRQDIIEISNSNYDTGTFFTVVRSLIYKHQKIIALSENIENLYSYIALMQLLWNTLVICCTGFVIIIVSIMLLGKIFFVTWKEELLTCRIVDYW